MLGCKIPDQPMWCDTDTVIHAVGQVTVHVRPTMVVVNSSALLYPTPTTPSQTLPNVGAPLVPWPAMEKPVRVGMCFDLFPAAVYLAEFNPAISF